MNIVTSKQKFISDIKFLKYMQFQNLPVDQQMIDDIVDEEEEPKEVPSWVEDGDRHDDNPNDNE